MEFWSLSPTPTSPPWRYGSAFRSSRPLTTDDLPLIDDDSTWLTPTHDCSPRLRSRLLDIQRQQGLDHQGSRVGATQSPAAAGVGNREPGILRSRIDRYQPRREAETEFDFAGRPRRQSGFVQQAVDRLCEHTYNPGPLRTVVGDGLVDSLSTQVYETKHIDCVMSHAEAQATLNDVCRYPGQVHQRPDKPVDLQLWGGDEFTVFTDPEDPRKPFAVVTIDRYNERTRYRLWFEDEVRTFLTDQYSSDRTAGARVAIQTSTAETNTYGCIPFAFVHYRAPVRQFWTPGPGTFLRKAELRINDRLSELDELIQKYSRPIGVFKYVSPTFTPEIGPGQFLRLCRGGTGYTGEGFADGGEPSAEYLQATSNRSDLG